MQQSDPFCLRINDLVQKYFFIVKTTHPNSEERKKAGVVYSNILEFTNSYSKKKFNLNQLAPQTLQFLGSRGLNLQITRAVGTKIKKETKKIKRPKVWDYCVM